jgi:hypothetical protein
MPAFIWWPFVYVRPPDPESALITPNLVFSTLISFPRHATVKVKLVSCRTAKAMLVTSRMCAEYPELLQPHFCVRKPNTAIAEPFLR